MDLFLILSFLQTALIIQFCILPVCYCGRCELVAVSCYSLHSPESAGLACLELHGRNVRAAFQLLYSRSVQKGTSHCFLFCWGFVCVCVCVCVCVWANLHPLLLFFLLDPCMWVKDCSSTACTVLPNLVRKFPNSR